MMKVAILALQGAFAEHQHMLRKIGIESFFVRSVADWRESKSGLIIPGGESTCQLRLLKDLGLFAPIRKAILNGLKVLGTCAGLIMLDREHLDTMNINVRRNAFGRQLGSFSVKNNFKHVGMVPQTYIRAPFIESVGKDVEVLSSFDNHIVAARQGNQYVCAFHPELNNDERIHRWVFLETC